MSQSNPTNYSSNQPSVPNFPKQDDEIDLRELFIALWDGKLIVILCTVVFAISAIIYAKIQPNVYSSSARLVDYSSNVFAITPINQLSSQQLVQVLNSAKLRDVVRTQSGSKNLELSGLTVSVAKNGDISISKSGSSPDDAYQAVSNYVEHINGAFKEVLLQQNEITMKATAPLLNLHSDAVNESLSSMYAGLLFQKSMLESADTQLFALASVPVKPTTHIKPKRALIVVLGTLLGGMLGVTIVLVRFAFRREDESKH